MVEESLKQKTKKGIYWKLFDQFMNYGMQFCVGIVMARLLTPSDFGITALPAVFMAVASLFIEGGFSTALIRKPEITEKDLSTAFYYSIVVGVTMYVSLFFAAPFIASFYNVPILKPLIRVTALNFLWSPLITPQSVILKRKLDFKTPARISVINKVVSAIVGIFIAYAGYGIWALVVSGLTSSFLGLIQLWLAVKWVPREFFNKSSFKYLWNFGNKIILTEGINKVYENIAPIVIGKFYSPASLGIYNKSYGYASLPSHTITSMIQSVSLPVLSNYQNDDEVLAAKYRQLLKSTFFVTTPLMLLLAALARPLIIIMITEKWIECIPYLQIMCFWMMIYPIHSINLNLLLVKGRSDLYLRLEVYKKILALSIMAISLPMGIMPFVFGCLINSYLTLAINTYYTGKLNNLGLFKQLMDILPSFAIGLLMFAVVCSLNIFISNLYIQVLVGGLVGVFCYGGLAVFFHFSELEDIKYMLKR